MSVQKKHKTKAHHILPRAQDGTAVGTPTPPPTGTPTAPAPDPHPTPSIGQSPSGPQAGFESFWQVRVDAAGAPIGPVSLLAAPAGSQIGQIINSSGQRWLLVTRDDAAQLRESLAEAAGNEPEITGNLSDEELLGLVEQLGLGGGLSFEQQVALEQLRQSGALEQIRLGAELNQETQLLLENLRQTGAMDRLRIEVEQAARIQAEQSRQFELEGLQSSLEAIGFAAPGLFVGAQDPAQVREGLINALETGSVLPTLARQELIADAANAPKDIIRLLFLAGGQKPPSERGGEFSAPAIFEQGREARDALAQSVRDAPSVTFEDLFNRFLVDVPQATPQAAAKGAVIEMRRGEGGIFRAAKGAVVTSGPQLFSVGEKGEEFALLAPGSVIAPKASKGEKLTQENAAKAVMEVLQFGRRLSSKETAGKARPKAALHGGIVTEAETPEHTLDAVLEGATATGAALEGPSRSLSERMRDFSLLLSPSQFTSPGERFKIFRRLPANLQSILLPRGQDLTGGTLQQALSLGASGLFTEGVPGTRLPVADIQALPPGAREAARTSLGALFGADVVDAIFALFDEQRRRAFDTTNVPLPITR